MKNLLFIKDTTDNKITFYHLAFFLSALPFDRIYSELALISLFIHTLLHLTVKPTSGRLKTAFIPLAIYLLTLIGTLYSPNLKQAFFEWEIQLSFLLFPCIFLFNPIDHRKYTLQLLFFLGISCVITICYLFLNACRVIMYNQLPIKSIFSSAFINQNFTLPIDLHATYFSMYIAVSVIMFIKLMGTTSSYALRIFFGFCLLVLFAGIFQLSSRSALVAFFIIIVFIVPFFVLQKKYRFKFIAVSLVASFIFLLFITSNSAFRSRYITDLKEDLTESVINSHLIEPRVVRWECAIELIKAAPILGYGSGSEVLLLKDVYFRHHFFGAYVNELNAHNQYLSIWIKTGIIGLIIYLFVLYKGFAKALEERNAFFLSCMVVITVVGFAENILDVNKGIFFFACFFSLFYTAEPKSSRK